MGREWVFKKVLMEIVLYNDLGEEGLVESRVRYIKRSYKDMFNIPKYSRVHGFLSFLERIGDLNISDKDSIQMKLEESMVSVPAEKEDLQAMVFYSWLKAKIINRNPYQVLLDVVRNN